MKKILLSTLAVIFTMGICFPQDVITKKTGDELKAKVLEVGQTEIKYKNFDNPDGPTYSISKSEVLLIRYENGSKDIFTEPSKPSETKPPVAETQPDVQGMEQKKVNYGHKYRNRIGFNIGAGSGFKAIPIATLSDGSVAHISFGGGTGGNLEYGHEFSRYFDLGVDVGYSASSLDKTVDNGSMAFNRASLSVTPAVIVPLTPRDKTRFKFGGGIDWFYYAALNFDLSKVSGGVKDDWKYNNGIGEHLNISFELNTNYKFQSGNKSYPEGDDLVKPNGSGVDFLFGVYYHFL
jgi:hypothetical protein